MSDLASNPGCFTHWPKTQSPLNRRLRGSQGLNGMNVRRTEKSITPIGIRANDHPAPSLGAIPTTLPAATRIEQVMGSKVLGLISSRFCNWFLSEKVQTGYNVTHSPIKFAPRLLTSGAKRPGCEAPTYLLPRKRTRVSPLLFPYASPWCHRGSQVFQICRTHLKILGIKMMIWIKFHNKDPQILGSTVQNTATRANWGAIFVHPCIISCS
jgi:hypothetical protein